MADTAAAPGAVKKKWEFEPPVTLGGFFGKDSDASDSSDDEDNKSSSATGATTSSGDVVCKQQFVTRQHPFPFDVELTIREISFHYLNANFVWPGARHLAGWIAGELPTLDILAQRAASSSARQTKEAKAAAATAVAVSSPATAATSSPDTTTPSSSVASPATPSPSPTTTSSSSSSSSVPMVYTAANAPQLLALRGKRILELGAATGCLAIWLAKHGIDVTTTDLADAEIGENIAHNFTLNGVTPCLHLPHTWGEKMELLEDHIRTHGTFDVLLASDIMNYEKAYSGLVRTLDAIFKPHLLAAPRPTAAATAAAIGVTTAVPAATTTTTATVAVASIATTVPPASSTVSRGKQSSSSSAKQGNGGTSKKNQKKGGHATSSAGDAQRTDDAIDYHAGGYHRVMYMSWQRRHKHKPEEVFFGMLRAAGGFRIVTRGNRIYEIRRDAC